METLLGADVRLDMLQVDRNSVKPPPAVEETYRGVAAPSRPKVNAEAEVAEMPKVRPTAYSPLETLEEACPVLTGCSIGLRAIYEKMLTVPVIVLHDLHVASRVL